MSIQEILQKLERKQTLSRNSAIRVQRTVVDEESLRQECEARNIPVRVELGMLIIG
jgi:hypothetical protein